jgi:hypothetical protein
MPGGSAGPGPGHSPSVPGSGPWQGGGVAGVLHSERLWPSRATWLVVPLTAPMVALALLPLGAVPAAAAGLGAAALVATLLVRASTVVEVGEDGALRAGRAVLPARVVAGGEAARGERARELRGPALDARTHLCLRGWVDGVVLLRLDDPQDPTPSWLVSTRHPERLLQVVLSAAERERGGA